MELNELLELLFFGTISISLVYLSLSKSKETFKKNIDSVWKPKEPQHLDYLWKDDGNGNGIVYRAIQCTKSPVIHCYMEFSEENSQGMYFETSSDESHADIYGLFFHSYSDSETTRIFLGRL